MQIDRHAVPSVAKDAPEVPDAFHVVRLDVVGDVDRLADDVQLLPVSFRQRDRHVPESPRPRPVDGLVGGLQVRLVPRLAAVHRHVHADDALAAAAPRVAA